MKRFLRILLTLVVLVGAIALVWHYWPQRQAGMPGGGGRFRGGDEGPAPVLVVAAQKADVPVYIDGAGTTRASNTVTVRSQVDGKILSIPFKEGQDVKRGALLAQIDPATYQASLDQAVAKKAQDEAQLANARIDLDRYTRLAATNGATRQQADTQRALVAQLVAQVEQDQAAIDNAKTMLDYTRVTSPIDGRVGIRQVDVGNLVRASDTTGIVVVTQLKPISVFFNVPQQQISRINKAFAAGPLQVEALGWDNKTVVDRGVLQVVDNQVDSTTGTVRLKADFPNPDLILWPGQFVNVRLLVETLRQVVVVPTGAIQRGPNGTFVYVLEEGDKVKMTPVTVGQQDDLQAVVSTGVQAGQRVVTSGFTRLKDGAQVTVSTPEAAPSGEPARPGEPSRRGRSEGNVSEEPSREGGRRGRRAQQEQTETPGAEAATRPIVRKP